MAMPWHDVGATGGDVVDERYSSYQCEATCQTVVAANEAAAAAH